MTKVLLAPLTFVLLVGCLSESRGQDRVVMRGKQLFMDHGCYGCHTVGAPRERASAPT
jgi:hypothetical protein